MQRQDKKILDFIVEIEPLKTVLRHSWLSSGRRESVAEHTWRMAVMAFLMSGYLDKKVNLLKTLKIILVHDLAEVYAGDTWAFKKADKKEIQRNEKNGFAKISKSLPSKLRKEILQLSREYMEARSPEARLAKAVDKLEVLIQHNQSDIKTQNKNEIPFNLIHGNKQTEYDSFLRVFRKTVKEQTLRYYKKNRVNKKLYKDYL